MNVKNIEKMIVSNWWLVNTSYTSLFWIEEDYRREPPSNKWVKLMGTVIEAIIGAYYLDTQDTQTTRRFIEDFLIPNIDRARSNDLEK